MSSLSLRVLLEAKKFLKPLKENHFAVEVRTHFSEV